MHDADGRARAAGSGGASATSSGSTGARLSARAGILAVPLLIIALGFSLSGLVWIGVREAAATRDRTRFEMAVQREVDRLSDRMRIHGTLMRGVSALFSANAPEPVTSERFAAYMGRLNIDLNYPGIQGIGFSLRLRDDSDSDSAAVLASARRRAPEFKLWPEHGRERHAIVFLEPLDARNRMVLGFDMFADPIRREAMERARDTASPALSARVTLMQEIAGQRQQAGFLMYAPVYSGPGVPDDVEARRSRLYGFVYTPFRAEDLLSNIYVADPATREISLALFDGPSAAGTPMFQTDAEHAGYDGTLRAVVPLDIAGHRWTAVATARPPFLQLSSTRAAPAAAQAGIAGTLVLAGLAWSQARASRNAQRARDEVRSINDTLEQRIAARTRELEIARGALQATNSSLEATVARRTLQLRNSINEAQRFVYVASHDLRAPLVNIVGFAGELGEGTKRLERFIRDIELARPGTVPKDIFALLESEIPEALAFIHSSTGRMERLIATILKLAREERRTLNPEILALDAVFTTIIDALRKQIESAGADVVIAPGLPDLVGDRVAVEQIFANLIENAVKYLDPARPGRIVLRGHEEGARVVVEVEDNGRGIEPQDHERVFELFRRAGAPDRPGEGLGLAFVRALVRRLDGEITLRSTPGTGTVFTVRLPKILTMAEPESADAR